MLINTDTLKIVFNGFNAAFNKGLEGAKPNYGKISMQVTSGGAEETYGWLGQFPKLREWVGDRVIQNLKAHSFAIANRKFESTISVPREKIEDDKFGIFAPMLAEMGKATAEHPDELLFSLLGAGFNNICYDGQYFFDTDHPVKNAAGATVNASNMQAGSGPAWFLLDTSRAIKPMVFQKRVDYTFQVFDKENDSNVFWKDEFVYGVRARVNAGFGLWQLAFASKAELNAANYEAARQAMMTLKGDEGRPLNIIPDTLVVSPALEGDAMRLLNNGSRIELVGEDELPVAITNEWAGTAKPIISGWL